MSKIIKTECEVGSVERTQEQIDADILANKKAEINSLTEARIFEILGVQNKEKALIEQANMQSEATRIVASKTIAGRYPAGGEARLQELGAMQEQIAAAIAKGKEAKAKL
jgi:hypothetical protein